MKVIWDRHKSKGPDYPQHRIVKCSSCGSILKAGFEDCFEAKTVLSIPAYYVVCPCCHRSSIFYCYKK